MKPIPYGRQDVSDDDVQAVIDVLRSDWLTQGPAVDRFERAVADYCGAKYAVAVANATAALHIACLAAGLDSGDVLWTSPNTFVASANCGIYCGADVDFVDIDPRTYNMSCDAFADKLDGAKRLGRTPKVVVPVHFAGQSCDMENIARLAKSVGCTVIEDASHAIGGSYRGRKVGACTWSDMTVFSFHPVKIVTSGEGGIVLTNREDLYESLIRLRSHGITRDPKCLTKPAEDPWIYEQIELGFNYRMTDIQAALGWSQMKRLDAFVEKRHEIADVYHHALAEVSMLTLPWQHPDAYSAFHLYVIQIDSSQCQKTRREIFNEFRQAGILVNVHYIPVHTQPFYQARGFGWGDFPEAERYYQQAISLPMYSSLSAEDQDRVIDAVREVTR